MDIETFRDFCLALPGVHDDFPFGRAASEYDRNLLVFYVGDKWFCFVNAVDFDFCNLKSSPERIRALQESYADIGPGWHMNKKHWISVRFEGGVPDAVIRELVRESYELVTGSLPKRVREALSPACERKNCES